MLPHPAIGSHDILERTRLSSWCVILLVAAALGSPPSVRADLTYPEGTPTLGARYDKSGGSITFRVYLLACATAIHLYLYDVALDADEKARRAALSKGTDSDVWSVTVPVADLRAKGVSTVYYGYRAWGPNWTFDAAWTKGWSHAGFVADVDDQGNRFNPNKVLIDPYAAELSHDPENTKHQDGSVYITGSANRQKDSGQVRDRRASRSSPTPTGRGNLARRRPKPSARRSSTRSTSAA